MRILWVDDQMSVTKTLSRALETAQHSVDHEPDGERARARLVEGFDLILADLAMPPGRWGGLWLLEEMKRLRISIPVVIVSGEGSQTETIEALRLGAADYVMKERLDTELLQRIAEVMRKASNSPSEADRLRTAITAGESDSLEFKSTLRWNLKANKADPVIELSAIKTIAAFLNSYGGTLLIGVADDTTVLGLDADGFPNHDKFQLHFWNRVRDALGTSSVTFIAAKLLELDGKHVFRVDCKRSSQPVYVRWKQEGDSKVSESLYVRSGPKTERLDLRDAVQYIRDNFNDK